MASKPSLDVYSHVGRHIILRYLNASVKDDLLDTSAVRELEDALHQALTNRQLLGTMRVTAKPSFKVGIIGAGAAGLYSAMMLQERGIPFKIFEATGKVGGRILTHKFSQDANDYFDVGPMRFPRIQIMKRLFDLFNELGLREGAALQSYVFTTGANRLLFNQINKRRDSVPPPALDPFNATGVAVERDFLDVDELKKDAIDTFVKALRKDLESSPPKDDGWRKLMRFDDLSARAYLSVCKRIPTSAINWMETMDSSTGSFDTALSEWVLESMAFGEGEDDPSKVKWYRLQGGSQVLADAMLSSLKDGSRGKLDLHLNSPVIRINAKRTSGTKVSAFTGVEVTYTDPNGRTHSEEFDHVISTVPLPVFRTIDYDKAGLDLKQEYALRQLKYGPAVKVGIKFKSQWWSKNGLNIHGGQSATDRSVRVVVYPSNEPCNVLIASYTWTEDATRLSGLINSNENPQEADERLKTLVLRDLAAVHSPQITYEMLLTEYVEHFAWAWDHYPYSQGAYAQFGPGDFQFLYSELTKPAAGGRLHFAGEALSVHHAWIVGALDSAWRAVKEILLIDPEAAKLGSGAFETKWGTCLEWDTDEKPANRLPHQKDNLLRAHLEIYAKKHSEEIE